MLLGIFAGALAGILVVTLVIVLARGQDPPRPDCPPAPAPCSAPPTVFPLVNGVVWRSDELGYQFEYDAELWAVAEQDGRSVKLRANDQRFEVVLWVAAVPAGDASAQALLDDRLAELGNDILGLTTDAAPTRQLLGSNIGYVDGPGGSFAGTADTPQGPGSPVTVAVMAASDGQITAVASVVSDIGDEDQIRRITFGLADSILNTFQWPSDTG
jgi:hypothetical protein